MRYAKKLNDTEIKELNPYYLEHNGTIYTNPLNNPNINISELGYKPLVVENLPTYDTENEKVIMKYVETDNQITRTWEVQDLTEQELQERDRCRIVQQEII